MNDSLRLVGKRALTIAVAAATILWSVGLSAFVPFTAQAYSAGDLIKGSLATVYYYGSDGSRYAFPNEKSYFTWYTDFSGVVTISDSALAAIPLAGNIVYRPGANMIKIQSDNKSYVVTPQGQIRWVETEAAASGMYGSDWNQHIDDVPDVFFVDYTVGTSLTDAGDAFNGALVDMDGTTYLVWNGQKRMVTDAGFSANNFQDRFVLDGDGIDLAGLTTGSNVTGEESALTDSAQLGEEVTGGLSVSLASDTAASATIPASADSVPFAKFKFTASSGSANISQIILHLGGVGGVDNIDNVYLFEGATRLTDGRSVNSSTRDVTFSGLDLDMSTGETMYLTAKVDVTDFPDGGDTANLSVQSVSSIVGSATVSGSFPVTGNTMTFSETPAGTLTVEKTGSISSPTLGEEGAVIGKLRVTADDEGASVEQIAFDVDSGEDHSNYMLWNGSDELASCDEGDGLVTCVLTNPLDLDEGDSETLELSADIGGDSGDTIGVAIAEEADVVAIGEDFGFNMSVDIVDYDDTGSACGDSTDDCSFSEIQGGELTFAFNGPSADDIQLDGDNEVLMEFALTAENFVEVKNIGVIISSNAVTTGLTNGGDAILDDITIRKDDGSTWMGPEELDGGGSDFDQYIDFGDTQNMEAGESLDLMITVDVTNDDAAVDEEVFATLDLDGSDTDGVQAEDINGDDLAADDIVPGSDIIGHDFTITEASLDVNFSTPPSDATYVKGASSVTVAGVNFTAGSTSDVTITDTTFLANIDGDGDESLADVDAGDAGDHVSSCSIYDSESGSLIDGPEGLDTDDQILFENFDWTVAGGETGKMLLKCNFSNTDVLDGDGINDLYNFNIESGDDIVAEDEDGDEVTASIGTDNTAGGVTTITIIQEGSLTATLDGGTPDSTIILGNSTGVEVATYKFDADDEAFEVQRLTLINFGSSDAVAESVMLTYENEAGTTVTKTGFLSGGEVTFDNLDFWVPTDETVTLDVSIDTNVVSSTGAASGDDIGFTLDVDTDFEAVGQSSGETVTDAGTDIDANDFTIRKTKPTITLSSGSPSGEKTPATNLEVLRFNVSADSRGFVTLDEVTFRVNSTDADGDWNTCGTLGDETSWEFYDLANPSEKLDDSGEWYFINQETSDDDCFTSGDAVDHAILSLDAVDSGGGGHDPEEIGAGDTNTYVVRIDTLLANDNDKVQLTIPDESEADNTSLDAIRWRDDNETSGSNCDDYVGYVGLAGCIAGDLIDELPMDGGAISF